MGREGVSGKIVGNVNRDIETLGLSGGWMGYKTGGCKWQNGASCHRC